MKSIPSYHYSSNPYANYEYLTSSLKEVTVTISETGKYTYIFKGPGKKS